VRVVASPEAASSRRTSPTNLRRSPASVNAFKHDALDTATVACAESRSLRPDRWDWLEIREYLVLKHDGNMVRFPVRDGEVAQARLRAALTQRPDDCVVAVTADAFIRVGSDPVLDHRSVSKTRVAGT
jgi:hypothetical protein